jgi:putative ABC transport system permease protein
LIWDDGAGKTHDVTIVGVVKDFHFTSFREEIKPFGFILEVNNGSTFFLKIRPQNISATLKEIEKVWTKHQPDKPFEYSFQDEELAKLHRSEEKFGTLFSWFTLLAVLIACFGLFGLVTALAETKTKEIGVRKVLGSSVTGIIRLLSREFIKLILIAFIIASPIAYFGADQWLQGFAYRILIDWKIFAIAGGCTALITLITISFRSVNAALANPVDSLRNE